MSRIDGDGINSVSGGLVALALRQRVGGASMGGRCSGGILCAIIPVVAQTKARNVAVPIIAAIAPQAVIAEAVWSTDESYQCYGVVTCSPWSV